MAKPSGKQAVFVKEYLVDLNATQAAIRAGYSAKTAKQIGSKLLTNVDLQAAVSEGQKKLADAVGVTAERVVAEYAKLGFANMADYITGEGAERSIDLSALSRDQAAAIQEMTVETVTDGHGEDAERIKRTKFKLADKKGALDSLARHLGMFTDKSELTVKGVEFIVNK